MATEPARPPSPDPLFANEVIDLWPDGSPNNGSNPEYRPRIRITYPALWRDAYAGRRFPAVLICPGGGYHMQALHEGAPFAQIFAMHGIVGVVLTYRVHPDRWPCAYSDATRAMRYLRAHADRYAIDAQRIGIMGFSAGGHLASMVATQPDVYHERQDDLVESVPARPDRVALAYPVISMTESAHTGSRDVLVGSSTDDGLAQLLSSHLHVSADTPPSFLFHTADDPVVPVANSLLYTTACTEHAVPVELHVYESGRHGVGMALDNPRLRGWTDALMEWFADWRLS